MIIFCVNWIGGNIGESCKCESDETDIKKRQRYGNNILSNDGKCGNVRC